MQVRAEKVMPFMHHYCDYHDHPLSGVLAMNGRWWWFERGYREARVTIRPMPPREAWRCWFRRLTFKLMVQVHRKPKWFWGRLGSIWYKGLIAGMMKPIWK